MSSINSYDKLSELYNEEGLGDALSQDSDFTIHRLENIHPEPIISPTFRANYYAFVLLENGNTSYTIDGQTFPTKNRTLYFTNPGHLKSFDIKERSYGFLITVSEHYLKENIHEQVFDSFSFLLTEIVPPCYLDENAFTELQKLARQIQNEQERKSPLRHKIVSSLFMVFLLKVKEHLLGDRDFKMEYDRESQIVIRFKKELERQFRTKSHDRTVPQVQDFAQSQQLHPSYFSTVIKTKTGKAAHSWIQEKLISEAKTRLANSTKSIKEIGYELGFREATHFSKYFKKQTGNTPLAYRKMA